MTLVNILNPLTWQTFHLVIGLFNGTINCSVKPTASITLMALDEASSLTYVNNNSFDESKNSTTSEMVDNESRPRWIILMIV